MVDMRVLHGLITGASGEGKSFYNNVVHYRWPRISVYFNGERKPHDEIWGPVCKNPTYLRTCLAASGDHKVEFYPPTTDEDDQAALLEAVGADLKALARQSNCSRHDKKVQLCIGGGQKYPDVVRNLSEELDGFGVRVTVEAQHGKAVPTRARENLRWRVIFNQGDVGRRYLKNNLYGRERAAWIIDWFDQGPRYGFVTKHPDRDPRWKRHDPIDPSDLPAEVT